MPQPCGHPTLQKIFQKFSGYRNTQLGADTKATSVELFKQLGWVPFYDEARIYKSSLVFNRLLAIAHPYESDVNKKCRCYLMSD